MKYMLLLSVSLMLPIHAMESQEDDQKTQLVEHRNANHQQSTFRKKLVATGLVTLLATAGVVSNVTALAKNHEPVRYQPLPWTGTIPANNETCTYTAKTTETWFHSGNRNDCFVGRMRVPAKYCSCPSTRCPVIIQECQDKDPLKQEVVTTSAISLVTQIGMWIASTIGIWCLD